MSHDTTQATTLLNDLLMKVSHRTRSFIATVDSLSGDKVRIKEIGVSTAETALSSRLEGPPLIVGDTVLCVRPGSWRPGAPGGRAYVLGKVGGTSDPIAPELPREVANRLYGTAHAVPVSASGTFTLTAQTVYYVPIRFRHSITANQLGFEVTTAAAGAAFLAIYASDGANDRPSTRIVFTLFGANTGTVGVKTESIDATVLPGGTWLYLAIKATAAASVRSFTMAQDLFGGTTAGEIQRYVTLTQSGDAGPAPPAVATPTGLLQSTAPSLHVRAA